MTLNEDGCVSILDLDGNPNNDNNCLGCFYGGNNVIGVIPANLWALGHLIKLSLGSNTQLNGSLPTAINNLVHLTFLNLRDVNLSGTIPEELGDLILLTNLNLSGANLVGTVPTTFSNLENLEYLYLDGCLLYTSPSPRDQRGARMPSSA